MRAEEEVRLYYRSPIGIIELRGNKRGLQGSSFVKGREGQGKSTELLGMADIPEPLKEAWRQLDEYFKGQRRNFSLKISLRGSAFEKKVWRQLRKIPFGQTRSYKDIAEACGHPAAYRAVGGANHKNPVAIIIPCHRVIGSNGKLTGFGAGLWRKRWLLQHEQSCSHSASGQKLKK